MTAKYGYSRDQRLLTPGDFRTVFNGKTTRAACPELLFIALPNQNTQSRIGFVFAKKHVKHAVQRNLIRRICREHFRLASHRFEHKDIVVLARKGAADLDREQIHKIVTKMLHKLDTRLIQDHGPKTPH